MQGTYLIRNTDTVVVVYVCSLIRFVQVLLILMLQASKVPGFQELQQKDHGGDGSLWERHGYRESEHCVQLRHA